MAALSLGLLADTSIQLSNLRSIVSNAKFSVACALLTRGEDLESLPDVDVWVVRIDIESERSQALVERLDNLDIPVIYDEADSYSSLDIEERAKRFSKKIETYLFKPQNRSDVLKRAKYVWILAASAGGPEAVANFVSSVPNDIRDVAFVYTQHMDEHLAPTLVRTLQRNSGWQINYCSTQATIYEKSIYLVSPSHQLEINEAGILIPVDVPWDGPYKPSVDQVIAKIWRKYKKDSGVIVFSGMGNDGAKTCYMIKNAGGQVWVQSLESCAVDSMPREVINTNCVSFSGTPEQLARHFSVYHKKINPSQHNNQRIEL